MNVSVAKIYFFVHKCLTPAITCFWLLEYPTRIYSTPLLLSLSKLLLPYPTKTSCSVKKNHDSPNIRINHSDSFGRLCQLNIT